jgi:hypothetical protein
MTLGDQVALFRIHADVHLAPYGVASVRFLGAARTSSVPVATPAPASSWGRIKTLYR